MGQTPSTPSSLLRTFPFPFSFFKREKRRTSKPRTKQQWKARRAPNKTHKEALRKAGKLLTIPQARKALKRDGQRQTGQRTNPRGNSKEQRMSRRRKRRRKLWRKKRGLRQWFGLRCQIQ